MSLTVTILIILLGLLLLMLEILVLPGAVVGIFGVLLVLVGITSAYLNLGTFTGHIMLVGTIITSGLMLYLTFRKGSWKRVSLNTSLKGKVNTFDPNAFKVGDEGLAVSRIAPSGKALINDDTVEVHSLGEFIDQGSNIKIVKLEPNKIFIKSLNT